MVVAEEESDARASWNVTLCFVMVMHYSMHNRQTLASSYLHISTKEVIIPSHNK